MKRLLCALLLAIAGIVIVAGPPLRAAFAATHVDITIGRGELHPAVQALNFLLPAPQPESIGTDLKEMKLWATYYHMPTVRAAKTTTATTRPLLGRMGIAISAPLTPEDWCDAAMQGSVWVDNGQDEPTAYMYVDSRGPEQNTCDKWFGNLSPRIKMATKRARFVAFHHPQACDVRSIPLMAFRTIAVDTDKIKIGTVLYIPSLRGLGFWKDGEWFAHDGYVVASDTGGAIEGNHIDMFVDNAAGSPFPNLVRSNPRYTFEAYVVPKDNPAARALSMAHEEVCKNSDRPGQKRKLLPQRRPQPQPQPQPADAI